jgi:hypothetical protein
VRLFFAFVGSADAAGTKTAAPSAAAATKVVRRFITASFVA